MVRIKITSPGSSPPDSPVQDSGSRNKRKFRADPPSELSRLLSSLASKYGHYEYFSKERGAGDCGLECHALDCVLYRGSGPVSREKCAGVFSNAEWVDLTETKLEEILLSNLDMKLKSAIKQIASHGYTEEVAINAFLRPGICCGSKDTVSNVIENAMAFLRSGQEVDSSTRENTYEDMLTLEKHVLADMVRVIREVRPCFSMGEAMWSLVICDMNLKLACTAENKFMNLTKSGEASSSSAPPQMESESGSNVPISPAIPEVNAPSLDKLKACMTENKFMNLTKSGEASSSSNPPQMESESGSNVPISPAIPEVNASSLDKVKNILPSPPSTLQIGAATAIAIPNLPLGRFSATSNRNAGALNPNSSSSSTISISSPLDEKRPGGTIGHVGILKKEYISRQRVFHHEKGHRTFRSKAAPRTGIVGSSGGRVLDKNSISTGTAVKDASSNPSIFFVTHTPQASMPVDPRLTRGPSALPVGNTSKSVVTQRLQASRLVDPRLTRGPYALPTANTELSLSLPSSSAVSTGLSCKCSDAMCRNNLRIPSDKMSSYRSPPSKEQEMPFQLFAQLDELQSELQEWSEWAQQKVMQAARRLGKDKAELQSLRQEKEEVERLKRETQILEENTKKKLSEMESSLSKTNEQVERANAAAHWLDGDRAAMRQQMEAEKLEAAKSAASCEEALKRELVTGKNFQLSQREKPSLQEELRTEKHKLSQLQQRLVKANESRNQLQARWNLEETMKDELLTQAASIGKEREQFEVSEKAKDNALRMQAETHIRKYKDDARRIEDQISQLKLTSDSSKMTALRSGVAGNYASKLSDGRKDNTIDFIAYVMDSLDLNDEDVQRDRECVMCLTEEMSVVFLPCAHQVVCAKCNELHEKQGMKDCPSCRTPIQRRICAVSAD